MDLRDTFLQIDGPLVYFTLKNILGRKEYLSSVNTLHSDFSPRASFLYSCSISSNYDVPRTLKIIRHDFDLKKERENHFHLGLELSLGDDRQI